MFDPRPSRWMMALVIGLIGLLPVLAVLQYQWLGRLSDGERTRMRTSLRTSLLRFSEDVDRFLRDARNARLPLSVAPDDDLPALLADRYAAWRGGTPYNGLFDAVYWVAFEDDAPQLYRLDPDEATLTPASWPAQLEPWRAYYTHGRTLSNVRAILTRPAPPLDAPALSLPVLDRMRPPDGGRNN